MRVVDVAIVGAGSAGMQAYKAAKRWTDSVVLIEGGAYGTTCAREGCMPSKLLIAAAEHAHAARGASVFGVEMGEVRVDGRAVMARMHRMRDAFVAGVLSAIEAMPDEDKLEGHARFREPGMLDVDGEQVRAGRIVLATGSVPRVPDQIREGAGPRCLTIADLFELDDLPESLVVLGAGVIGIEAAQMMARLGVRVRCLSKGGAVANLTDERVSGVAATILGGEFPLAPDADIQEVSNDGQSVSVTFAVDGEAHTERFDYALAATGRVPNVEGLALENAGLRLNEHGVPLADRATCQAKAGEGPEGAPVFVAGDVEGNDPVLPVAVDDGRIAGDNAGRWPEVKAHERKAGLLITYTRPSIGVCGMSLEAIREAGLDHRVGEASFADQGRAKIEDRAKGLVRVYGEWATGRILGAELVAPDGEHHAHLISWLIGMHATVANALAMPVYHPCTEEAIRSALRELARELLLDDLPVERIMPGH